MELPAKYIRRAKNPHEPRDRGTYQKDESDYQPAPLSSENIRKAFLDLI
jgi:hypothetical protein